MNIIKGATREGAKEAEATGSLSQVIVKEKDKISDSFDYFCVSVI